MVQWSPLLKLPYWDPGKFLVVDPMHNLFLGLAASRVRKVLLMFWEPAGKTTRTSGKTIPVGNVMEAMLSRVVEVVNGFESAGVNTPEEKVTWLQEYNVRTLLRLCDKLDKPFNIYESLINDLGLDGVSSDESIAEVEDNEECVSADTHPPRPYHKEQGTILQ